MRAKIKLNEINIKFEKHIKEGRVHVATKATKKPHFHLITMLPLCEIAVWAVPSFEFEGGKDERNSITSWLRRNEYTFTTRNAQDCGAYLY
jgi:hypothetical protein